jgi:hypothetical protein
MKSAPIDRSRHSWLTVAIIASLLGAGGARAEWRADGIPAALPDTGAGDHRDVAIAPDGAGGAFIVWQSAGPGFSHSYLQHLTRGGTVAPGWPLAGVQVATPKPTDHAVALADGQGGVFVASHEIAGRSSNVALNHFDAEGAPAASWASIIASGGSGVAIGADLADRPDQILGFGPVDALPTICPNGNGGVWMAWFHVGFDWSSLAVCVAGINRDGLPAPGGAMKILMSRLMLYPPVICGDGAGGAFVAWTGSDLYAQHVIADGSLDPRWPAGALTLCDAAGTERAPGIVGDGSGGFVVAWQDDRNGRFQQTYAERILADGSVAPGWQQNGRVVCPHPTGAGVPLDWLGVSYPQGSLLADGTGGAFIAWNDYRDSTGTGDGDIYVQHLSGDGAVSAGWPADGFPACALPGDQRSPRLADDGSGGVVVGWQDARLAGDINLYAQRLSGSGAIATGWPATGLSICSAPGAQESPALAVDATTAAPIAAWLDRRGSNPRAYAGRVILDQVTPALVSLETSEASPLVNRIVWQLSAQIVEASVERRQAQGGWESVARLTPSGTGRIRYDDHDVVPGERYGYRLRIRENGTESVHAEVWLTVPDLPSLALHGARPNPIERDLVLSFALASGEPALIELFDTSGRRVVVRDVGGLGAGEHTVSFARAPGLAAGIYFARLSQGGRSRIARVCVVR